ncbi:hypothetical protein Poli38472_012572 [Pythium oligandrum]|uniref:FYVE-type domain-containing protein n=1 Tax=Pythium oligandrum TaxID=41045 RepID=A0A8K1FG88_PYTOL|nr:hypothetical protein Poli38472_012572 [Pythium oligandrum]|eukprot:TMW61381.1 hypothetical protein Poli38472_012572 [Pythium oligandrum]
MKKTHPMDDFPTLLLSEDEQRAIVAEAEALLVETLHYERTFLNGSANLDKKKWKEINSRDNFRVYKERNPSHASTTFFTGHDDSIAFGDILPPQFVSVREGRALSSDWMTDCSEVEGIVASIKDPRVPMLIGTGSLEGSLEDVVFGSVGGNEVSWRLRSAYAKDKVCDAKILATIRGPSNEAPYRFLGIKWFAIEPCPLTGKRRDFLAIEATGTTIDRFGVLHAYHLIHEFQHPSITEKRKTARCRMSMSYISRQVSPTKVHVFARGFAADSSSSLAQKAMNLVAAETMVATANLVEASYAKKLGWMMAKQVLGRQKRQENRPAPPTVCSVCHKPRSFLDSSPTPCHACGCSLCSRCTVQRKIVVDISSTPVTERQLSFCFSCVLDAKQLSPREVALETATKRVTSFVVI